MKEEEKESFFSKLFRKEESADFVYRIFLGKILKCKTLILRSNGSKGLYFDYKPINDKIIFRSYLSQLDKENVFSTEEKAKEKLNEQFLTNPDKQPECRMLNCSMEEYLEQFGVNTQSYPCDGCPLMRIANELAKYEDKKREIF